MGIAVTGRVTRAGKNFAWVVAGVLVLFSVAGCRVQVDKSKEGKEKKVAVETPVGDIHVNTDDTSASDLGLPLYPGATRYADKEGNKSADVHLGFGEWQLKVKVVSYTSSDAQARVEDFYKKALSRYGDVLVCSNGQSQNSLKATREGLTCNDDDEKERAKVNIGNGELQFKAGSRRHQHIVNFVRPESSGARTQFELIALDLPASSHEGKESN